MNPKDQIKENLSITDVVSTYVRLEKSGSQFRACCPFHNEKTPSFYVSPERKSFHCFGCQVHGDIFTFVEKIENIPFFEALKILADRAGVQLLDSQKNKEDSRLITLLKDATEHFEKNLKSSPEAMKYLLDRGITDETIKTFHIGYAKNEWRDLFIFLSSQGYSPEEMEQAGITIKAHDDFGNTKGWYDRFRGRIMFPIRNVSGATVGYSGRIMPALVNPSVSVGKYVNTPETSLYHKSKILFGYDTAKKKMAESKEVIVVEGQMDLCMSYQAGIHNTVAVSGTAFTDEHINLIKRFCNTVILSFDTDNAGQSAFKKTALLCLLGGLDVYTISDIGTKDPADLIKDNPDAWLEAIKNKKHVVEAVLLDVIKSNTDKRVQGQKVVSDVLPFVRAIQSPVDRSHFIRVIADQSHIQEEMLMEELLRGNHMKNDTDVPQETIPAMPKKEMRLKEIITFATYAKMKDDSRLTSLHIDFGTFPEAVIEEEIFKLEEKMVGKSKGEKEKYFDDIIRAYRKEVHKEELILLQQKYRADGADKDAVTKEIHEHVKRGAEIVLGELS